MKLFVFAGAGEARRWEARAPVRGPTKNMSTAVQVFRLMRVGVLVEA